MLALDLLSRDPEQRAEAHLRLAARDHGSLPGDHRLARRAMRHLEHAAALSSAPRYLLALGVARYERYESDLICAESDAPGGRPVDRYDPNTEAGRARMEGAIRLLPWETPPPAGGAGESDFLEVLRLDPENPAAHCYLGILLLRLGRPDAEAHFLAAAAADADNALPLYLAAALRVRAGDPEGAVRLVREGNARPASRLYRSPAAKLEPTQSPVSDHLQHAARLLIGESAMGLVDTPGGKAYGQWLLQRGRTQDALDVAEAVWAMGRRYAATEPLDTMHASVCNAIRKGALDLMEAGHTRAGDAAGLAEVQARRTAQDAARDFWSDWVKRSDFRRDMSRLWRRMLPGVACWALAAGLSIGAVLCLVRAGHSRPAGLGLAAGAVLSALAGRRLCGRAVIAWSRALRAEKDEVVRGFLSRLP